MTAIKNTLAIAEKAFYAAITSRIGTTLEIFYPLVSSAAFTNSYNKANEIIVKLNDKDEA